jgi:uncharacterized protein (TIGR03000 family)
MRHKLIPVASMIQWRKHLSGGLWMLLIWIGVDLPHCRAQLEFNGGYVQTHREDHGEVPHLAASQRSARSPAHTPSSYFPDRDFYYPSYYLATASAIRSYYAGGEFGNSLSLAARRQPFGIPPASLPWNLMGFQDYDEIQAMNRESTRSYSLAAMLLPQAVPAQGPAAAVLIAHLPEHALFWVEGIQTRSTGRTRYFQSPPLLRGRQYSYRVRAAWIENGQWVSQTRQILVQAGRIQAIYLQAK